MSEKEHKIVVKRSSKGKGGHHGGAWKIAYADFMTAMMAFFLVMWLLSISSPKQLVGIAEYFRTPLKVAILGGDKSGVSRSVIPGGGADIMEKKDGEVMKAKSNIDRAEATRLKDLKKHIEEIIESKPELKQFRPQLLLELTPDGLRIQIIDSQNRPMFKLSSSVVEPYMRTILREIGPVLNELPNKITLSGHSDALAYHDGDRSYSNWELSADRANASRREMVSGGLKDDKILRVTGVAAAMPFNRKDLTDPANRRISILVLNRRAQQRIEEENGRSPDSAIELQNTPDTLNELKNGDSLTSAGTYVNQPGAGAASSIAEVKSQLEAADAAHVQKPALGPGQPDTATAKAALSTPAKELVAPAPAQPGTPAH